MLLLYCTRNLERISTKLLISACIISIIVLTGCSKNVEFVDEKSNKEEIIDKDSSKILDKQNENIEIIVHISGAIKNPGIIRLVKDSRVYEAIEKSGGFLEEADQNSINLARKLIDGEHIVVKKIGETIKDNKININSATEEELQKLNGIGKSMASTIVDYRNMHGGFQTISDLKKVRGIKDNLYNKIKDRIKTE